MLGHTKGNTKSNRKKIQRHQSKLLRHVIIHLEQRLTTLGIFPSPISGHEPEAEIDSASSSDYSSDDNDFVFDPIGT